MKNYTITAISTAPGNGAVGVIRLSGPDSLSIFKKVWGGIEPDRFEPKKLYFGEIQTVFTRERIDSVLATWMKAPSSYTGEDVVEIQAHGGRTVLEMILGELTKGGARLAEPGEFSLRAFKNGKIDLVQAEAIADLINATSRESIRLAERQISGILSQHVQQLKKNLLVLRAQMEAMIDFPEDEDVQGLRYDEIMERVETVRGKIDALLRSYQEGRLFRDGITVAIVGRPNAGKSSLLNALVENNRAIVHETPGTTRDLVEERILINGLQVRFFDTAGLRKNAEPIEKEGIRRTLEQIQQADLILAVFDSSQIWGAEDQEVLAQISEKNFFLVYNKIDLSAAYSASDLMEKAKTGKLFQVSAKSGEGIAELKRAIYSYFTGNGLETDLVLTNLRHKIALEKGAADLEKAREAVNNRLSYEFIASDLQRAANHLSEVTGEISNDSVLSEIFSKFCIGK